MGKRLTSHRLTQDKMTHRPTDLGKHDNFETLSLHASKSLSQLNHACAHDVGHTVVCGIYNFYFGIIAHRRTRTLSGVFKCIIRYKEFLTRLKKGKIGFLLVSEKNKKILLFYFLSCFPLSLFFNWLWKYFEVKGRSINFRVRG